MSRNLNSASPQTKETASPSETPEQRGSSHTNVIVFQLDLAAFNGRILAISAEVTVEGGQRHISSTRSSRDERRLQGPIQQLVTTRFVTEYRDDSSLYLGHLQDDDGSVSGQALSLVARSYAPPE